MKVRCVISCGVILVVMGVAGIFAAQNSSPDGGIVTKPVYVPNMSHASDPLPAAILAWDATTKATNVPDGTMSAHLTFSFTNQAPFPVMVTDAHGSCSCTTVQSPSLPWTLPPGANSQLEVTVNLAGKFGTIVKSAHIETDQGSCDLVVQITILPPPEMKLTDAEIARQMEIAKVDRQAVFKNDCATCHLDRGQYRYGKDLYDADCGICHEAEHRASMVPDLHSLKVPTNMDFWRTWIAHGKAGSFMPAFATSDGGPLNDMQIESLASYLNATIPSKIPAPQ
jgi:mono/diheme cytochrome c family protein